MASEIRKEYTTAKTMDGVVLNPETGHVWYPVGKTWETWGTGSRTRADYAAVTMSEVAKGYYVGDFPTAITTADTYDVVLTVRGGTGFPTNGDIIVGKVEIKWSGTAAVEEEVIEAEVVDLWNRAITKIGVGTLNEAKALLLDSIDDDADIADLCTLLYPQIRKEVLCRADWPEATKYADLGEELSDIDKADWEYAFNLPSDYLGRCIQINEDYHSSTKARYIIEYDKEIVNRMLFTNDYTNSDGDSAYIKYIYNLTDISKFSPLLFNAIATLLAAELSSSVLSDKGVRRMQLLQEYEDLSLPVAAGEANMQQGDDEWKGKYSAITCRQPI